jgi:trehalose synthase
MLPEVRLGRHCCAPSTNPDNYRPLVGDALIDEIHALAQELTGIRVCQINATAAGGGVAELLGRQIPLLRALGIEAEWRLIHGSPAFFALTKSFHNALQGAEFDLTATMRDTYRSRNRDCAAMLEETYDVYIVHDPQPAALRSFARDRQARWIWRCHIDSSTPNAQVWGFLKPYIEAYDAAVFTLPEFCPPDLHGPRLVFIPPAIDPLSTKNMALPADLPQRVLADAGVDLRRPLLLQVSRFDPWKDPLGVIRAYQLVKAQRPEVQLALVGAMAGDDPEGWAILETINAEAAHDTDIYVFTNLTGVGNMEVNAFQRGADVILQKSLKEGFGLVVSEALWKAKPLVAGRAGGIPMQFPEGYQHYLVNSVEDCAARVLELLDSVAIRETFGQAGQEKVRQTFLLPRLVCDELRLLRDLLAR